MFFLFIGLVFINLFLYYGNYLFLVFFFMDICFLGKKCNIKLLIVVILGFILFFSNHINYYSFKTNDNYINKQLIVLEKYEEYSIVGKGNEKYLIYNNDYMFYEGSKLHIKGMLENIENTYNSFYKYLNKKGINYKIDYNKIYIIKNNKKMNEIIVDRLMNNKSEVSKSYLKLILFNIKDENNEDFYNTFSIYSLTYLIAVSGFHIKLLLDFFRKIFKNNVIGYCFVIFYLYLLDFGVSSYRAFLCYVFKRINRKFKFSLSNNDIISLIGSVFLFINPSIMFSYSFIYSFLATFVLEIFRLYSKKRFFISFYIYLINIPLILFNYYKLNLSTLLLSSILSYPISCLYVFSFFFLFLDKFYLLYELFISLFLKILVFFNNFNCVLVFGKPSVIWIILYYVLLFSFFIFKERRNKIRFFYLISIFLFLIYQYCIPLISYNEQFYFLNVGQGDCSIFFIPNSKEAVVLDTGGSRYNDIAKNTIIPFLESKGINKINKIIITHDDFDHNGALNSLVNNFNVGMVIESSNISDVIIGKHKFDNLNISDSRDNDGSLVLYGEYAGYDLLLMGDASKTIEEKINDKIGNVDIIKVGHHGSNTSSDYKFLDAINGKIAIISVGKNNIYGHPDSDILKKLHELDYIVLRTDEHNNIGFGKNIFGLSFIDYFK